MQFQNEVMVFSLRTDGDIKLSPHFRVKEFACKDGSDTILICPRLVGILQEVRWYFDASVTIVSGYRTETYNQKVGGAEDSQHKYGKAADIVVTGISPDDVAGWLHHWREWRGGLGWYDTFTHVDTRVKLTIWDNRAKKNNAIQ